MRIIAGKYRGYRLVGPDGKQTTRPITDRVKTSLFDRLSAAGQIEDAIVLDLFSGTGSLGIECLSRGAKHVTFVDRDRTAINGIKKNLNMIQRNNDALILPADALGSPKYISRSNRQFTLVFVDPPYQMLSDDLTSQPVYSQIHAISEFCQTNSTLILRTSKLINVPEIEPWIGPECHNYGSMTLHHFTLSR